MKESNVQKQIINLITERKGYVKKYQANMYSGSGKSDLIACYKGDFISIEVKKPGAKTDPYREKEQRAHLRKVLDAGGYALLTDNVQAVVDLLDAIDNIRHVF